MPLRDIVVLTLIVSMFTLFGVVLASVCWYCRDAGGKRRRRRAYPAPSNLITDDD